MLTIALFGPIASAVICLYLGRYLGAYAARLMLLFYITSAISAITLAYYVVTNQTTILIPVFKLSTILGTSFEIGVSSLDSVLLAVILLVSTTVNTYSIYYMDTDAYYIRFIGLMCAFASYMCILVVSTNILTLFICWELIGIFSYLLISYWSDRYIAIIASFKAIAMNKVGDYGYTLGLILLIIQLDSTELSIINNMYQGLVPGQDSLNTTIATIILVLFVIAASAKSAQMFLHN